LQFPGPTDLAAPRRHADEVKDTLYLGSDACHIGRVFFHCLNICDFFVSALEKGCPSEVYNLASPTPPLLRRGPTSAVLGQLLDSFKLCIDEFLKFGVPPT